MDSPVPPAIGRISYGMLFVPGSAVCTGTLISADIVLTAGHCLKDGSAHSVRFAVGVDRGRAVTIAEGAAILRPAGDPDVLAHDVALLRLARPVSADLATPLALIGREDNRLRLVSYRRDAPGLRADALCATLLQNGSVLGLDCPAVSGNSGAPLMQAGSDGRWQVVAVMVAQNRNPGILRSYAVEVPPDLIARAGLPDQWRSDP